MSLPPISEEIKAKAMLMRQAGASYRQIAEACNVNPSSVYGWIKGTKHTNENTELLTDAYKIKLLSHIEDLAALVLEVMPEKILSDETSLKDLNGVLDTLLTKYQLLRGAATASIEITGDNSEYKQRLAMILEQSRNRQAREDMRNDRKQ